MTREEWARRLQRQPLDHLWITEAELDELEDLYPAAERWRVGRGYRFGPEPTGVTFYVLKSLTVERV